MGVFRRCVEERGARRQSRDADRGRGRRADPRQVVRRRLRARAAPRQRPLPTPAPQPADAPAGSLLGGLSDLIGKLTAGGAGAASQFLGRPRRERADPAGAARRRARLERRSTNCSADRHEPAGIVEPAGAGAAAAHQSHDAERPSPDARRLRALTSRPSRVTPCFSPSREKDCHASWGQREASRFCAQASCGARAPIRRRGAAAPALCRAPGRDPRPDRRRPRGRPTAAASPGRCRAPRAARASAADGSSSRDG